MITKYKIFEEHKLEKNQKQLLNYIADLSISSDFIFIDTETTGLGGHKKQQLTQISAIACNYNFDENSFERIDAFDEKIKLNQDIINSRSDAELNRVLTFNHYKDGNYIYMDEQECLLKFFKWLEKFHNPVLVIQNASFDMNMLCGRSGIKLKYNILDTKKIIQLFVIPITQKLAETSLDVKKILDDIGTSERDNGLINSSMSKWGPFFSINMKGYHDALTDCDITMKLFTHIVEYIQDYETIDISKYQIERIRVL